MKAPKAKQIHKEIITHEHKRIDPYFWMNERDHKDVIAYINAENQYAAAYFEDTQSTQDNILKEFESNIDPNDKGAPFFMNGNWYQRENLAEKDYSIFYKIKDQQKFLFLDENERALNQSYYDLASWQNSPDNALLAMSEDYVGRRNYQISFRKNKDNSFLDETIESTDGSVEWSNDNNYVFYVKKDPETLREYAVYRHKIGTASREDVCVFEEKDERFYVFISKSKNKEFIQINLFSSTTSETHLIDANEPLNNPKVFIKREQNHLYEMDTIDGASIVLSNKNAPNNFLYKINNQQPQEKEITLEHNEDVLLEEFSVFKNHLVVIAREKGLRKLIVINLNSKLSKEINMQEDCYSLGLFVNEDFNSSTLYYSYNSLTTPAKVYALNMDNFKEELHYQKKVPNSNFDEKNYTSQRTWAIANDGEKVAISIVKRKDVDEEKAPLLLYAYGSYGITIPTNFSAYRLSLLDRGFVFAIAHIRGSKYLGENWYQNGKFLKKKNTFTDYINCAEHLIRNKFCRENGLYGQGGSAGGMLMGAVANMAPYLFKGIIAQVPFVDVVTTMLDESIPLTVGEFEEWGNPKEEDYYQYMLSYSPYDNVKSMHYPSMFVSTGYHDSQVQYWEPLKWIAKLRELNTDENTLIFDCNMDAGHSGGSGRSTERKEIAKNYGYLIKEEGLM